MSVLSPANYVEFRAWCQARLSEVDELYDLSEQHEGIWNRIERIGEDAGKIAARLGLPLLASESQQLGALPAAGAVKHLLAHCLETCTAQGNNLSPYLTAAEAIQYLRLDDGSANPHEKLRNLCRRQGLPRTKKGKRILFKRTEIDAWMQKRN